MRQQHLKRRGALALCVAAGLLGLHAAQAQTAASQAAPASPDTPMPLVYEATAREAPAVARTGTCPIHVVPALDRRQNQQTIGASIRGALLTGEASPWVTEGLMHLKDWGYTVQRADASAPAPAQGVVVKATLTRAYTWQVGLKLFSMIALKAEFADKNGVLQEKYYRAHGDKTNMWGAPGEYVTALNYGLNNLLRVMADDLSELCKGSKVEPTTYAGPEGKAQAK